MICWWGHRCLTFKGNRHHELISSTRELASSRSSLPHLHQLGNALENRLKEVSNQIIGEMTAWNASHPQATLLDIEVKARELVSKLEAHLIEASALQREPAD